MGRRPSVQTLKVLGAMLEEPTDEHYGLALSKQAELPSGSIYTILKRLEEQGWVVSRFEEIDPSVEGRPRKRLYQLTGAGAREARAAMSTTRQWLFPSPNSGAARAAETSGS